MLLLVCSTSSLPFIFRSGVTEVWSWSASNYAGIGLLTRNIYVPLKFGVNIFYLFIFVFIMQWTSERPTWFDNQDQGHLSGHGADERES